MEHGTDIKEIVGRINSFLSWSSVIPIPKAFGRESIPTLVGTAGIYPRKSGAGMTITEYQELQMQEALKKA